MQTADTPTLGEEQNEVNVTQLKWTLNIEGKFQIKGLRSYYSKIKDQRATRLKVKD